MAMIRCMANDDHLSSPRAATTRRAFLSVSAVGAAAATVPLIGSAASAENESGGFPVTAQLPDRQLRQALREIDAGRIEAIVRRLAAFGTRHTSSSQDDPVRGIGAARDWI